MNELGKYQLPKGWAWATIPALSGKAGAFIDGDWLESKDQDPSGDVRLIQLADVGDGVYRDKSDRFMTKAKADALGCTFLKVGDVLIARMPDPLGRACLFPGDTKPSVTVVDVAIVRSGNGEFDHRWLACFVNAHPFRSAISGLQAGSTRKRISRGNLATIPLPVPPLLEQRRIVAEIEMQFTRLEAGVAAFRRMHANLKRYRAAVLTAACEGRLVSTEAALARSQCSTKNELPAYETGQTLLARILTERRQKWQGRGQYKQPSAPDIANLQPLPEGWAWATAAQLTDQNRAITYGVIKLGAPVTDGVHVLRSSDVRHLRLDMEDVKRVAPNIAGEYRRTFLKGGEVLITVRGTLGGVVVAPPECTGFNISREVAMLAMVEPAVAKAAAIFIGSPSLQRWLLQRAKGIAYTGINIETLKELPIPLPPLEEQMRIVAEVERRLSVVDELEAVVSTSLKRATRLRRSILQKAFTGNLVPQNASDESAEISLNRIKNTVEKVTTDKKKTKSKEENIMPSKSATNLGELLEHLNSLGGAAAPDRLLAASGLGEEVERFFDLLREGRNNGALIVPTGTNGDIKKNKP